jgi:hypothetical protein
MASALFLGSWAALMGPMIYGMSAQLIAGTLASRNLSDFFLTPDVDLVAVAAHAPHASARSAIVADH